MSILASHHEPCPQGSPDVPGLSCAGLSELKQRTSSADDWVCSEAWLEEVVQAARSQTEALFTYFRFKSGDDLTVMIMSLKDYRLGLMFPSARSPAGTPMSASETEALGDPAGGSELLGGEGSRKLVLWTTYLYYSVLHHILRVLFPLRAPVDAPSRFRARPTVDPSCNASLRFLLSIPAFHSSLLAVAATLVQAVACKDAAYLSSTPEAFLRHIHCSELEHNMLAVWNACRWFQNAFSPAHEASVAGSAGTAPAAAAKPLPLHPGRMVVGRMLRLSEERLIMADGSTFYHVVNEGVDTGRFTDGDQVLLAKFIEAYARRAAFRAAYVAAFLVKQHRDVQTQKPQSAAAKSPPASALDAFPMLVSQLADRIVGTHLQLCCNQHMSVIVACCVYAVARSLHLSLPFDLIVNSFVAILPDHTADMFYRQVELQPAVYADPAGACTSSSALVSPVVVTPAVMGGTRDFYNKVFLSTAEGDVRSLIQEHLRSGRVSAAAASTTPTNSIPSKTPAEVRTEYHHPGSVGHGPTPKRRPFSFGMSPQLPDFTATPTPMATGPQSMPPARTTPTPGLLGVAKPVVPGAAPPSEPIGSSAGFLGNSVRSRQGYNVAPQQTPVAGPALVPRSPALSAVSGITTAGGSKARPTPGKQQVGVLRDLPQHNNVPTSAKGKGTTGQVGAAGAGKEAHGGLGGLGSSMYYTNSPIMGVTGTQQDGVDKENGPWQQAGAAGGVGRKSGVWNYR